MWSVYLDTHPVRVTSTRLLGMASRRAYLSPLAFLRTRQIKRPPLPGTRWVRVRNHVAGIAEDEVDLVHLRPDAQAAAAASTARRVYLGHEVAGEVIETGPDVQFLRVGDRVIYQLGPCCATRDIEPPCRHCAAGNYSLCENRYLPGPQAVGGGWSDEMVVHERQLYLMPDGLIEEQAALLEPAAISVHAVLRRLPQPGESVLVIGTAPAGLMVIQAIHALVPNAAISALPSHQYQVEMATRMGATHILYPEEGVGGVTRATNAQSTPLRISMPLRVRTPLLIGGFDVIFDTVGATETLQHALQWAREGGAVVLTGRRAAMMSLDMAPVWRKEITLIGAVSHGTEDWPRSGSMPLWGGTGGGRVASFSLTAALLRERRLSPERLVTHRFPLREVRHALRTARNAAEHRALKVLLDVRPGSAVAPAPGGLLAQEAEG